MSNYKKKDEDKIIQVLKQVSGISFIIIGNRTTTRLNDIVSDVSKKLSNKSLTFKVETKRIDKNYPLNSLQISMKLGELILKKFNKFKVDVHKPELLINIEIKHDYAIFYFDKIKGMGGFPIGINGKVLMLISGGIDSPVAAKLLIKKGFIVDFLTFITPPHTNPKALAKVKKLIKVITINNILYKSKLYICNFTNLQHELSHMSLKAYQITIMRRYFFRIARDIAIKNEYQAIATGESLGQVASQTIESMQVIANSIDDFLVLRPLLTYDKQEIVDLAKKYETYEISIEPYIDCCALFVPKNPTTRPTIKVAEKIESELELAKNVYKTIIDKIIEE
jgi:thiamine biosynthesis protein ThiI